MGFYVYILQSHIDNSLYIGHTGNIEERLLRHNQGRSKYTKSKRPWKVVHTERFESRSLATKRERNIKSLHRKDLLMNLTRSTG
jgi:putative endonuclease